MIFTCFTGMGGEKHSIRARYSRNRKNMILYLSILMVLCVVMVAVSIYFFRAQQITFVRLLRIKESEYRGEIEKMFNIVDTIHGAVAENDDKILLLENRLNELEKHPTSTEITYKPTSVSDVKASIEKEFNDELYVFMKRDDDDKTYKLLSSFVTIKKQVQDDNILLLKQYISDHEYEKALSIIENMQDGPRYFEGTAARLRLLVPPNVPKPVPKE